MSYEDFNFFRFYTPKAPSLISQNQILMSLFVYSFAICHPVNNLPCDWFLMRDPQLVDPWLWSMLDLDQAYFSGQDHQKPEDKFLNWIAFKTLVVWKWHDKAREVIFNHHETLGPKRKKNQECSDQYFVRYTWLKKCCLLMMNKTILNLHKSEYN